MPAASRIDAGGYCPGDGYLHARAKEACQCTSRRIDGNASGPLFPGSRRTRNFTRAAEECNVTQPSLTRAIKQLEYELGGDLFWRERPAS